MNIYNKFFYIAILFIASQFMVACDGSDARKVKYLEKGKAYIQQKNYDKAKVELKNVIQIDPKYAEAYYLLGTVAETQQNWRQAYSLYTKATELDKNHLESHARLGRFYLLLRKNNKARDMMELVLEKDPTHASGRLLKAGILHKEGNTQGAVNIAQALVKENPNETEAVIFLTGIYIKQDKDAEAVELLNSSIGKNKEVVALYSLLAQIYAKNKDYDKAEQQLQKVVVLEPQTLSHRITLASFYYNSNQIDKAENTLRDAIKADPDDAVRYLHLAELLAKKRGDEVAEKELLAAINSKPDLSGLRFGLAKHYLGMKQKGKAEQVYKDIIDKYGTEPEGLKARNRLAVLSLQKSETSQAQTYIDEILKENPRDNDALITKGKLALIGRDAQTAIGAFRTVLKDQPGLTEVAVFLADAHMLNNEVELARETLFEAIEANPKNERVRLSLARLMIKSRDFDNALEIVDEVLLGSKNNLMALRIKVETQLFNNNLNGAFKTLKQIKTAHPEESFSYQKTGQIYLAQKKYAAAVPQLELALKKQPNNFSALTSLIQADLNMREPKRAIKRLQDILKAQPKNAGAHQLMAEVYINQKKYEDAENELLKATQLEPKWDAPYSSLAILDIRRGNKRAAIERFREGLEHNPGNLNLTMRLASTHETLNEFNKAIDLYESVLKSHPGNTLVINNLAALLVDHKTDKQSLDRARELVTNLKSAKLPAVLDTLGWVYHKTGDSQNAVQVLKRVVEKAPKVPVFQYHLGMAYSKTGDTAAARKHLKIALDSKSDFPGKDVAKNTLDKLP